MKLWSVLICFFGCGVAVGVCFFIKRVKKEVGLRKPGVVRCETSILLGYHSVGNVLGRNRCCLNATVIV